MFIQNKIINGEAHLISESDTTYLKAARKGRNGNDLVTQPNSETLAKPRCFSFNTSVVNNISENIMIQSS